jgi:hypothetical protein
MVNDGRSSLQKAAGKTTSSLKNASRRGRNVNSFEVGAGTSSTNQSMDLCNNSTEQIDQIQTSIRRDSTKKVTKKQHFTIISSYDDEQHNDSSISNSAMDVDATNRSSSHSNNNMMLDDDTMSTRPAITTKSKQKTQTSFMVGLESEQTNTDNSNDYVDSLPYDDRPIEQMEGVIDQSIKMPLVVLDGANVAYAYATAMSGLHSSLGIAAIVNNNNNNNNKEKLEPDARGIQIATEFFIQSGLRVLVVLPQYWFRSNNNNNNYNVANRKKTMTLTPQLEILGALKTQGLIVASPPTDDDDAYALTIAQREENRSLKEPRNGDGPGFVLSNDLFRDAQQRDPSGGRLKNWLNDGRNTSVGRGRISYTFGDMGTMNDRGERILDFVPNPRHPLLVWMESKGEDSIFNR